MSLMSAKCNISFFEFQDAFVDWGLLFCSLPFLFPTEKNGTFVVTDIFSKLVLHWNMISAPCKKREAVSESTCQNETTESRGTLSSLLETFVCSVLAVAKYASADNSSSQNRSRSSIDDVILVSRQVTVKTLDLPFLSFKNFWDALKASNAAVLQKTKRGTSFLSTADFCSAWSVPLLIVIQFISVFSQYKLSRYPSTVFLWSLFPIPSYRGFCDLMWPFETGLLRKKSNELYSNNQK